MRNKVTRVLALLLFFFISASEFNVFYSTENFDFANEYTKLPAGVLWKDKSGLRLNLTLYKEKGFIVYGDYTTIKNNDFKVVANGYYTKNGVKGEYRYHGYTAGGSMYSNTDFPDDMAMTRAENTYRYIYRIWEDIPTNKYYNANRLKYPSDITYLATSDNNIIDPIIKNDFRTRINAAAPYTLINPLNGDGKFYNYANIQTMPTWYNSGDFRMDHLGSDNKLWYMDNSLGRDKIEKKHKPVEAEFIGTPIFYGIENILKQGTVKVEVELSGFLNDADLFDGVDKNIKETDELLRKHYYYNRQDIDHWELSVKDKLTNKWQKIILNNKNVSVQSKFTIEIPYSAYSSVLTKDKDGKITTSKIKVDFDGIARVVYKQTKENGEHIYNEGTASTIGNDGTGSEEDDKKGTIFIPKIPEPESGDESPIYPELEEPFYMLDTEKFKLFDRTDTTNVMDRWMLFDGEQLSDEDEEKMLNGEWLFPLTGEHEIHEYDIFWANDKGRTFHWRGFILVYSTKARVQVDIDGSYKENRLHTAYNNITSGNPKYVIDRSTYETLLFDIRGQEIYTGTKTDKKIEFISKLPYEDIEIDLQVECKVNPQYIERDDIPADYHVSNFYTYKMHMQEDHNPDIYCVVWNSVLTRNEELQMTLDIASYDGDIVSDNVATYKLFYDEDKDGVAEKLIKSGAVSDEIRKYKPDKLGMYEIIFYTKEEFGQPTLSQYITEADKKFAQIKRQFYVENLAPSTQIYTDIPADYPKVDVILLNDENISRDYNQSIVESRISFANDLIRESLNPYVYTWDLHTYVATQEATTTKATGTSYPPASVPYASGGYSGTLNMYDKVNNQEWEDHGRYVTRYETVTVTGEQEGSSYAEYDSSGKIVDSGSTNQPTMDIGGVTASKDSWQETTDKNNAAEKLPNGNTRVKRTYKAQYSAQIKVPVEVWIPNEVLVDRWTGYYKGYIYKYVKQQFEATFRDTSNKYIIYMAKDKNINNIEDLHLVRQRASSKLILVGTSGIKSAIAHDFYIDSSLSLQDIYKEIAKYISNDNPMERGSVVLIGEEFETSFADLDPEKDPLEKGGFQTVHDKNYFDNPMTQEANTNPAFVENVFNKQVLPNKLNNAGKYIFHRQINDLPVGYPEKSEYSNTAMYVMYAHRKPIANFGIKWEYNINTGYYDIEFEDRSYDLDLELKDPLGKKGIRENKLIYYNKNDNIKYYTVPTRLLPGTYVINYYAKDNFGVWSDVYIRELILPELPPPQVDAKLKAHSPLFSLNGIPASENLFAYDIWTKYPYDVNVRLGLVSPFTSYRQLLSANDVVRKNGQEMFWKDQMYNIPATVKNGTYTFNVRATDSLLSHRYSEIPFNVIVKTPINLDPVLSEKIVAEKTYNIKATTSKYVNTAYSNSNVKVTMFYNTAYAATMTMNGNYTNWNKEYRPTKAIPEGMYMAKFVATLPSGEFEEEILYYQYVYNTPPKINGGDLFEGSVNLNNNYIYENDNINFTLYYQDIDLTPVTVDIKLYDPDGKLLNHISKEINPVGNTYPPFDTKDYSEIYREITDKNGNKSKERFLFTGIKKTMSWDRNELKEKRIAPQYKLVATVTDDYGETSTHELGFDVHDLWVNGEVTHTEKWEENRQKYNTKYPDKTRDENTYWSGEAFVTNANTTEIDIASNVVCTKVSVEIINSNKPADKNYLSWLYPTNTKRDKWNLYYANQEWDNKWGSTKPQKLILRFTAYFNNNWIETDEIEVIIDNQDSFWKLHREW